jgi:hypothetical protein
VTATKNFFARFTELWNMHLPWDFYLCVYIALRVRINLAVFGKAGVGRGA